MIALFLSVYCSYLFVCQSLKATSATNNHLCLLVCLLDSFQLLTNMYTYMLHWDTPLILYSLSSSLNISEREGGRKGGREGEGGRKGGREGRKRREGPRRKERGG